jgi:FkbM family methyltransferase
MSFRVKIVQKLIHWNENLFFYPKLKRFYQNLNVSQNPIIFDVGVNKGQSIDFFSKLYPNAIFYGFEPNKKLYNFLVDKYRDNKKVKLYNLGVSSQNGTLLFQENIMDETSSFEELNIQSSYLKKKANILGVAEENIFTEKYYVEVIKLSDFIDTNQISEINILKVDVEGHEYAVFEGLFNNKPQVKIQMIQFENHEDDMYLNSTHQFQKIHELLSANNYESIAKINHGFGEIIEEIYQLS